MKDLALSIQSSSTEMQLPLRVESSLQMASTSGKKFPFLLLCKANDDKSIPGPSIYSGQVGICDLAFRDAEHPQLPLQRMRAAGAQHF